MSFWDLSDGEDASETGKEFDGGGGSYEVIPDRTKCLAVIDEIKWDSFNGGPEFISVRWNVLKPEIFDGRKVFQKIWASDHDPNAKNAEAKHDKALRMLAAIDANAGGKLSKLTGKPEDSDLNKLCDKPMVINIMVWEMTIDGQDRSGNWVSAVMPKSADLGDVSAPAPKKAKGGGAPAGGAPAGGADLDDEIPFAPW